MALRTPLVQRHHANSSASFWQQTLRGILAWPCDIRVDEALLDQVSQQVIICRNTPMTLTTHVLCSLLSHQLSTMAASPQSGQTSLALLRFGEKNEEHRLYNGQ